MLAYVFWHSRREGVTSREYEEALARFHEMLASSPPDGLMGSLSFRVQGAAWLAGSEGYEDWYLLRDSGSLDNLNWAAVNEVAGDAHQVAAKMAASGIAGLYRPLAEPIEDVESPSASWFDKPDGVSYQVMRTKFAALAADYERHLWQRMMTLGPTPEFCLLGRGNDSLPFGWESALTVRRKVAGAWR